MGIDHFVGVNPFDYNVLFIFMISANRPGDGDTHRWLIQSFEAQHKDGSQPYIMECAVNSCDSLWRGSDGNIVSILAVTLNGGVSS